MEKLLIILTIILAVVGIAQIAKVYQLSSELQKRREEDISPRANRINANLLLLFVIAMFGFFIYHLVAYGDILLPVAASEHGAAVDTLFDVNWGILFIVFFVVNFLLFFFSWKYVYNPNRKAYYFAHDNRLELIWTVIPSIALAFLIIYGLRTWNQIMEDPSDETMQVQLYAKQFDWTARYPGPDGELGESSYLLITGQNPLGLITDETIKEKIAELREDIEENEVEIATEVLPDSRVRELEDEIGSKTRQIAKIIDFQKRNKDYSTAYDDIIVKGEFHLPIREDVSFQINSRDVIHSAYMPHFRAQMNAVPGMTTRFGFKPTITTDSMRTILEDEAFNYILLCNKVCGSAHYNMQMNVIVESKEKFQQWLSEQKPFVSPEELKAKSEEDKEEEGSQLAEKN